MMIWTVVLAILPFMAGEVRTQTEQSTWAVSKVVVRLHDVVDQPEKDADGSITVPVHWIPMEPGSAFGNLYRTLATPQAQKAFLARLKGSTGELTFAKVRDFMTAALSERLRPVGGELAVAPPVLSIDLTILPGPWVPSDPFASGKREGVLISAEPSLISADGQVGLEVKGILVNGTWTKVSEALALLCKDIVDSVRKKAGLGAFPRAKDAVIVSQCPGPWPTT